VQNSLPIIDVNTKNKIFRYSFSRTEQLIFFGITLGHTDKEIADDLNMSTGSLRNYVYHIKVKTGLKNRTQISLYAILSGMMNNVKIIELFQKILS
jgi:DNA-binding NarL/FixJ family response regulator